MSRSRSIGAQLLTDLPRAEIDLLISDCTLEEIGAAFGVTRERARQILGERGLSTMDARRRRIDETRSEIVRLAPTHTSGEIRRLLGISSVTRYVEPGICKVAAPPKWTREAVIAAIQEFAQRYGSPPGAQDWNPAMARANGRSDVSDRFYTDGCWPTATTVASRFGSWNAGIRAAGLEPRRPGIKRADHGKPTTHDPKPCAGCGQEFVPFRRHQRYCGRDCYHQRGLPHAHHGGLRVVA